MRKLLRRMHAFWHRGRLQRELEDEMAAHREMMPEDRRRYFGSALRLREEAGDQWGWTWLDHLRQDLFYALRSLRRSPGFAATAITVLSLGIGVNLAELHVFNAALHRLQVHEVDSLCRFFRVTSARTTGTFSLPEIEFYREHNTALSAVIAELEVPGIFRAGDSANLTSSMVSGDFFTALGVAPAYGRLLDDRDDRTGAPAAAVLSYTYWQNHFGGDPGIVSHTVRLNDRPVEVVGIASPEFFGLVHQPTDAWLPLAQYPYLKADASIFEDYHARNAYLLGRLKPGVSMAAAEGQFRALTAELRDLQPQFIDSTERLKVQPAEMPPNPTPAAILLFTTLALLVLLVLLSACANLGNMLLARGLARQQEMGIRLAVGAGRWRLIRQLMTENAVLALLASAASLAVGRIAAQLLLRLVDAPPNMRVVTDWRIIAACAALGLLATFAFGMAPAFQTVKRGPKATRARQILVATQVAVSCVLLIVSSFFTRAVQHSFRTAATFDFAGMAVVDPAFYLRSGTPAQRRQSAQELTDRVRRVPGVDAVSLATVVPLRRSWIERLSGQALYLNAVDPTYFPMMRLPLLQGRLFAPGEQDTVVLAESAARRMWPNESPVGKAVSIAKRTRTITGVVKDSGVNVLTSPDSVEAYFPIEDVNTGFVTVLVHTTARPELAAGAIRSAATVPGMSPTFYTFEESINRQLDALRRNTRVFASLGTVASLLALLGIFGLLAFTVAQRTREIGIRMALGARGRDVLGCVLGQYTLPVGIGAACGVLLAAVVAKIVRTLVFGFLPFDVVSFGMGLLLFAGVAVAASIAPSRRALRIDPASAIRYE